MSGFTLGTDLRLLIYKPCHREAACQPWLPSVKRDIFHSRGMSVAFSQPLRRENVAALSSFVTLFRMDRVSGVWRKWKNECMRG